MNPGFEILVEHLVFLLLVIGVFLKFEPLLLIQLEVPNNEFLGDLMKTSHICSSVFLLGNHYVRMLLKY